MGKGRKRKGQDQRGEQEPNEAQVHDRTLLNSPEVSQNSLDSDFTPSQELSIALDKFSQNIPHLENAAACQRTMRSGRRSCRVQPPQAFGL